MLEDTFSLNFRCWRDGRRGRLYRLRGGRRRRRARRVHRDDLELIPSALAQALVEVTIDVPGSKSLRAPGYPPLTTVLATVLHSPGKAHGLVAIVGIPRNPLGFLGIPRVS